MPITLKSLSFKILFIPILCAQCTSAPKPVTTKQTQGSKFNHEEQFRKSWEALIRTATAYPLVEQSPEDGNIESGWVYETDHQRYRFFIQLLDRTPYSDIEIDVEYQELDLEVKRWRVKTPPLNYELSFLKNFQENLHALQTP